MISITMPRRRSMESIRRDFSSMGVFLNIHPASFYKCSAASSQQYRGQDARYWRNQKTVSHHAGIARCAKEIVERANQRRTNRIGRDVNETNKHGDSEP